MKRRWPLLLFLTFVLCAPLVLPDFRMTLINYVGLYALVTLGLVLLTGVGGLTSFGQAAFVGLGAYTTAYLSTVHGISPWINLLVGLVLTGAVAATIGAITLHMRGHFLPLATMAWGISLYYLFGNLEWLGGNTGISGIPVLGFFSWEIRSERAYYYLIWAFLLLAMLAVRNLLDSRTGRAIRALKGGVIMAESFGVNTPRIKIKIFLIAALLAALSGWLYAHLQRFINPTPFSLTQGIEFLFMGVLGGIGHVWGAIAGALVITEIKQVLQKWLPVILGQSGNFEMIFFGIAMILILQRARNGLWPVIPSLMDKLFPHRIKPKQLLPGKALSRRSLPANGTVLLEVQEVSKFFGGLAANQKIGLEVKAGEILALIGPNGAGKSTLFNCISGVSRASSGQIQFLGERIETLPSREIARRGMSRTFQHVRLLPQMNILENVAIGAHLRGRRGVTTSALRLDRSEEASLLAEAARQVERVGLSEHLFDPAGSLALGKQRIVEIARALASDPCMLLLDEPAAGLRHLEKQALSELLRKLRNEGMGILLVEHDMDFVMGLADRVVVMEFGEKLAEGLPQEIQENPQVLEAYLGGLE